jgi:hypothetical protein
MSFEPLPFLLKFRDVLIEVLLELFNFSSCYFLLDPVDAAIIAFSNLQRD